MKKLDNLNGRAVLRANKKWMQRGAVAAFCVGFCALLCPVFVLAKTPQPPGLFTPVGQARGVSPEARKARAPVTPAGQLRGVSPEARKARAPVTRVKVNRRLLRRGRLFLTRPGGLSYEAVRRATCKLGGDRFAWVGHASGDPTQRVVIGISGTSATGTFVYQGKLFKLQPTLGGDHEVLEVAAAEPAPEHPALVADLPVYDVADTPQTASANAQGGGGSVIDILVAYTPAVEAIYGSAEAVDALIIQAVAETNQAYSNSQMTTRLNLVLTTRTDYLESGSMGSDLARLTSINDGRMDELHALRDAYGADVVSLIENDPQYCGIAYRMKAPSPYFQSSAFNIVHHGCATGYYSFAHEVGHNQGAHHDYANATGSVVFPYAFGYQNPAGLFRTIMAYDCAGGCTRAQFFSSASTSVMGFPSGTLGAAENARAIDETAPIVADFRVVNEVPPAGPEDLSVLDSGSDQVSLGWLDMATDETGFSVERSGDGITYAEVAVLPPETTSYSDPDLTPGSFYYYRVRAQNDAGYSPFSNVALASTDGLADSTDYFVFVENTFAGSVVGNFEDTQVDDGIAQAITEVPSSGPDSYGYLEHYWAVNAGPGDTITLYADIAVNSAQSFTFAYATSLASLTSNPSAWVDMFSVNDSSSGERQFSLPEGITGPVIISLRDDDRIAGTSITADTVSVDYLMIRSGSTTVPLPPAGC